MQSCEGGSTPVNTSGLRGSKNSCCSVCEGGTYRPYLSSIQQCLPCPPGYYCAAGTLHPNKRITHHHKSFQISIHVSQIYSLMRNSNLSFEIKLILMEQVQNTTRVTLALLGMFVQWDPLMQYHAPLAPLVTSLMLRKLRTATYVQLVLLTTSLPRRPAFLVAAPPPHLQVLFF